MVVVAILSMLTAIGIPFYQQSQLEARRNDGKHLLKGNAQRLERCFTLEGVYNGACKVRTESKDGYYQLREARTEREYRLIAIPTTKGSQNKDVGCNRLILDHTGYTTATGKLRHECW